MIYISIIAGIFLLEWLIKEHIEKNKSEDTREEICGGALVLRKYHNQGAFLDFGEKKRSLVAALSALLTATATVCFVLTLGQKGRGMLKIGLSLLLGGAFSNTYDRLKRKYVVDYVSLHVRWKYLARVVFNLSDFFILIGALLLALGWEELS